MKQLRYFVMVIFSLVAINLSAQDNDEKRNVKKPVENLGRKEVVDTSVMECVYEHYVYDPHKKRSEIEDWILEIGLKATKYGVYGTYQRDSVIWTDYVEVGITSNEFDEVCSKYRSSLNEMIKYIDQGLITYRHTLLLDKYIYEESIPTIDWVYLPDDVEEVCGYRCKKAEADYRGRKWTAWYAEDILISNGPWTFGGLPGLILKVEDSKKEHIFEAQQIRKSNNNIRKNLSRDIFKVDRKTLNKEMKNFYWDLGGYLAGNPLAPSALVNTKKKRRMFYNPIELD